MSASTHLSAPFGSIAERFNAIAETAKIRFARHRVYRQTFNELSELSNRDLADLGLHRSELRRVAYHAARDLDRH